MLSCPENLALKCFLEGKYHLLVDVSIFIFLGKKIVKIYKINDNNIVHVLTVCLKKPSRIGFNMWYN